MAVGAEALLPNKMLFLPEDNAGHPVTEACAGCGEVVEITKLTLLSLLCWQLAAQFTELMRVHK